MRAQGGREPTGTLRPWGSSWDGVLGGELLSHGRQPRVSNASSLASPQPSESLLSAPRTTALKSQDFSTVAHTIFHQHILVHPKYLVQ